MNLNLYTTQTTQIVQQGRRYDPNDTDKVVGDLFPISIIKENNPYNAEIGY